MLFCVLLLVIGTVSHADQKPKLPKFILGKYSYGGGFGGVSTTFDADGDFHSSSWSDEVGYSPIEDFGTYEVKAGKITLTSNVLKEPQVTYYIVPWDTRTYLLAEAEIARFVKAIQSGDQPALLQYPNFFLVHDPTDGKRPKGLPILPPKYRGLLRGTTPVSTDIPSGKGYLQRTLIAALKAYKLKQDRPATVYAKEVLRRAPLSKWDFLQHGAYLVLGMIQLRKGHTWSAKKYLLKASKFISIWGNDIPDTEFLTALCLKGAKQAVLAYSDAYAKRCATPAKAKAWRQAIMQNKIPLFKPEYALPNGSNRVVP